MITLLEKGDWYKHRDLWSFDVEVLGTAATQTEMTEPKGTGYIMQTNGAKTDAAHLKSAAMQYTEKQWYQCHPKGVIVNIDFHGLRMPDTRRFEIQEGTTGNLSYMDGGTNTTAINPGRLGFPVINYVHFPKGMKQTLHTHPSPRVGLILSGFGQIECDNNEYINLVPGSVFMMERNTLHNFMCNQNEDVTLFVFAPDSGTGPTDEVNPLKVRTYVGQQRV